MPNFATLAAPLHHMTTKDFKWDTSVWESDYEAAFYSMRDHLSKAKELFYPDYALDWTVHTDASTVGVGRDAVPNKIRYSIFIPKIQ